MKTYANPEAVYSLIYEWELKKGIKNLIRHYNKESFREEYYTLRDDLCSIKSEMEKKNIQTNLLNSEEITKLNEKLLDLFVSYEIKTKKK